MGPLASEETALFKRNSTDAGFDAPLPIKQRRTVHHQIRWKQSLPDDYIGVCQNDEVIRAHLLRSIALALEAVGFQGADPRALEDFRVEVEDYIVHFLASVRQSMLSGRRRQAIAPDFLWALRQHQLTLRSLLPHLDPPIPPSKSQVPVFDEVPLENFEPKQMQLIDRLFGDENSRTSNLHIPQQFPALPSRHTYKSEPVFAQREEDTRKIRERATEEGRLGEKALRKLVGANSEKKTEVDLASHIRDLSPRARSQAMWMKTMEAVAIEAGNSRDTDNDAQYHGETDVENAFRGSQNPTPSRLTVNMDKIYWRKPVPLKPARTDVSDQAFSLPDGGNEDQLIGRKLSDTG